MTNLRGFSRSSGSSSAPRATGVPSLSWKILRAVLLARTRLLLSAGGVFSLSLSARFFRGDSRGCSWRPAAGRVQLDSKPTPTTTADGNQNITEVDAFDKRYSSDGNDGEMAY